MDTTKGVCKHVFTVNFLVIMFWTWHNTIPSYSHLTKKPPRRSRWLVDNLLNSSTKFPARTFFSRDDARTSAARWAVESFWFAAPATPASGGSADSTCAAALAAWCTLAVFVAGVRTWGGGGETTRLTRLCWLASSGDMGDALRRMLVLVIAVGLRGRLAGSTAIGSGGGVLVDMERGNVGEW